MVLYNRALDAITHWCVSVACDLCVYVVWLGGVCFVVWCVGGGETVRTEGR